MAPVDPPPPGRIRSISPFCRRKEVFGVPTSGVFGGGGGVNTHNHKPRWPAPFFGRTVQWISMCLGEKARMTRDFAEVGGEFDLGFVRFLEG